MKPIRIGGSLNSKAADSTATDLLARSVLSGRSYGAKASMVNRTHRVVRERARAMHADRSRLRSMLFPLGLCSALMVLLYSALWVVVDQYEAVSDTPHQIFMVLLWFLPASAVLVAMVWFRRSRNQSDTEVIR